MRGEINMTQQKEVPWRINMDYVKGNNEEGGKTPKSEVVDISKNPVTEQDVTKMINNAEQYDSNDPKQLKMYLVCFVYKGEPVEKGFEMVRGQANVRQFLKNIIDQIDIFQSFLIVEDFPFGGEDGKPSVYHFLKWMEEYYDDGFDVEIYRDDVEEEYEKMQKVGTIGDLPSIDNKSQIDAITAQDYDVEERL